MTDPTESTTDLTDKTLDIANNSGLEEIISEISSKYNLSTFEQQSQIPIPLDLLEKTEDSLSAHPDTSEKLEVLHELINDPSTALEFPFLINGETGTDLTSLNLLYSQDDKLESRITNINQTLLGQAIRNATESKQNIYMLSHTHPKISSDEESKTLTSRLTSDIKIKYKIKDVGLNISLQDLYQLVAFQEAIKPMIANDARVYIGILMFNGEMNAISIVDGKFKKALVAY